MSLQLTTYFYQSDAERAGPVAFKSLQSSRWRNKITLETKDDWKISAAKRGHLSVGIEEGTVISWCFP